jgi:hypothetical protein
VWVNNKRLRGSVEEEEEEEEGKQQKTEVGCLPHMRKCSNCVLLSWCCLIIFNHNNKI